MITDQIDLHSVLLKLYIVRKLPKHDINYSCKRCKPDFFQLLNLYERETLARYLPKSKQDPMTNSPSRFHVRD